VLLQYNEPLHGIKRGNILKHPTYHVTQDTMVKYYGSYFPSFIESSTSYMGQPQSKKIWCEKNKNKQGIFCHDIIFPE
jgi:hypothetical protein